jgi:hypothetical protein
MPILRNWSVISTGSPYTAPEARTYSIEGQVYGHNGFEYGDDIMTSQPVKIDGRVVTTASGTKYELEGPPKPEWVAWLFNNGYSVQQFFDNINNK